MITSLDARGWQRLRAYCAQHDREELEATRDLAYILATVAKHGAAPGEPKPPNRKGRYTGRVAGCSQEPLSEALMREALKYCGPHLEAEAAHAEET